MKKKRKQRKQQQQQPTSELAGYVGVDEWLARHAGAVFPNRSSFDWFVKRNRHELVEAGALITREGRSASLLSVAEFPRLVIKILRRRALEKSTGPDRAAA